MSFERANSAPRALDRRGQRLRRRFLWIVAGVALTLLASMFIGRYPKPWLMPPSLLWTDPLAQRLVFHLRVPRVLAAFFMGMALASAGAVLQAIFRNPLVSSGFMGVSQGAAFGAALSIIFISNSPLAVEVTASIFGLAGLAVSYLLASNIRWGDWVLRLVLAGMVSSALFSSGLGVLKYVADPLKELPDIVFWLLGGLWAVGWDDLLYVLPFIVVGLVVIHLMRWRVNLLSLRDEMAFSLGAAPTRERLIVIVASVMVTAVTVAVAGTVGWVGLIVPHLARRVVGADNQRVIPASMLMGGVFTVVCDNLARTLRAGEVPLGIITSLLGALVFSALFFRRSARLSR